MVSVVVGAVVLGMFSATSASWVLNLLTGLALAVPVAILLYRGMSYAAARRWFG